METVFKWTETRINLWSLGIITDFSSVCITWSCICSRMRGVALELDCPPQIFFVAYFNLDLLFINIERTSWLKNPDTGSLKEKKSTNVLWTSESWRHPQEGTVYHFIALAQIKLWRVYVTGGKWLNFRKTRNNLSKEKKSWIFNCAGNMDSTQLSANLSCKPQLLRSI